MSEFNGHYIGYGRLENWAEVASVQEPAYVCLVSESETGNPGFRNERAIILCAQPAGALVHYCRIPVATIQWVGDTPFTENHEQRIERAEQDVRMGGRQGAFQQGQHLVAGEGPADEDPPQGRLRVGRQAADQADEAVGRGAVGAVQQDDGAAHGQPGGRLCDRLPHLAIGEEDGQAAVQGEQVIFHSYRICRSRQKRNPPAGDFRGGFSVEPDMGADGVRGLALAGVPPAGEVPIFQQQAQLLLGAQVELPEDVLQVGLDRLVGDPQEAGDLVVALAQAGQGQDLLFALAEGIPAGFDVVVPEDPFPPGLDQPGQDLFLRASLLPGGVADGGDQFDVQGIGYLTPLVFQRTADERRQEEHPK